MGGSNAPAPTPPTETSAASTSTNVSTAIANAYMQNMNEVTPYGTKSFDKTGSESIFDPYTGMTYEVPRFTVSTDLSEQGQGLQSANQVTEMNLANLAADQSGFLGDYMRDPFQYGTGEHEKWALDLYDNVNGQSLSDQQEQMRQTLANQGISAGSDVYAKQMAALTQGQNTARDKFLLDTYQTGMNTALTERNQPINEIIGLMSGSQVQQPTFQTASNVNAMPTTDNAAIIGNYDNALMNQWASQQGAAGSMFSAAGGLFSGLGSLGLTLSDERAKDDKEKIGETEDGLGIYSFRYKGSPKTEIGLMAQEVKKKKPKAVAKTASGLMAVNYEEALK